MRPLLVLGLLLAVAGSTFSYAQDEDLTRYYPLGLGDTWIYGNYDWDCFEKDCDLQRVFVRRTVVGETVIDDEAYAVVEVDVLDPDAGTVRCTSTYGARVDVFESDGETEAFVGLIDIEPPCNDAFLEGTGGDYLEELRSLTNNEPSLQTVYVGGVEYDLMIRGERFYPDLREVDIAFAQDVGLVYIDWWRDIGPGFSEFGSFALQYAEVGGVAYGMPPVASEPSAPASGSLAIDLHPNPTRGPLTLRVTGTAVRLSTVEVFDILGRRVLRRDLGVQLAESEHRLDLAEVPAGLYIVRVSSGTESITKRLVKAE